MKTLLFIALLLSSNSAFGFDQGRGSLERLAMELNESTQPSERTNSVLFFFNSLEKAGLEPVSFSGCFSEALDQRSIESCIPNFSARTRSGSGTGGVD